MANRKTSKTRKPAAPSADFRFENHGSICFLIPVSDAAKSWADEHISTEGYQPYADRILIEPRYVVPVLEGIQSAGMDVRQ